MFEKKKWRSPGPMVVWNKLKRLRIESDLTQTQVSAFTSVAVSTIWAIENGYDRRTTNKTKKSLADFFQVNVEDLFPVEMIGYRTRDEYLKGLKKD